MDQLRSEARHASADGWTMMAELISAIGVWGAIGFGLDKLFGTRPILFAVGMVLGAGVGVWIVYWRATQNARARDGLSGERR